MEPGSLLIKAFFDQVLKRLPDPKDKVRLRIQDALLQQQVDRNKELERVADLLGTVMAQRDQLQLEASRLAVRVAELEARLAQFESD